MPVGASWWVRVSQLVPDPPGTFWENPIRLERAVSPLEPVQSVLRVAEVPVERPVTQLEHVLHRRALAAPMAP